MQNASPPPATLFLLQRYWVPCMYRMQAFCKRIMPCMKKSHRRWRGIGRNFGVERSFSAAVNNSQENEQLLGSTAEQGSASHGELNTRVLQQSASRTHHAKALEIKQKIGRGT